MKRPRQSKLTAAQALLKLRTKHHGQPRPSWRQIGRQLRPAKPFNGGLLNLVANGKRDAANDLRAALGVALRPIPAQPCWCGEVHTKGHPRDKKPADPMCGFKSEFKGEGHYWLLSPNMKNATITYLTERDFNLHYSDALIKRIPMPKLPEVKP